MTWFATSFRAQFDAALNRQVKGESLFEHGMMSKLSLFKCSSIKGKTNISGSDTAHPAHGGTPQNSPEILPFPFLIKFTNNFKFNGRIVTQIFFLDKRDFIIADFQITIGFDKRQDMGKRAV